MRWCVCVLKVCHQALLFSHLMANILFLLHVVQPTKMGWSLHGRPQRCAAEIIHPNFKSECIVRLTSSPSSHVWGCAVFPQSALSHFNTSLPLLNACTPCKEITVSLAHQWLERCLQSPRWDWITEYFMKRCLLPNNSLKFRHIPSSLLSQVWGTPFPSSFPLSLEIEEKFKGSLSQLLPLHWRCSAAEGSALQSLGNAVVLVREKSCKAAARSGWNRVICAPWELETWDRWVLFLSQGQYGEFACFPGVLYKCFPLKQALSITENVIVSTKILKYAVNFAYFFWMRIWEPFL